MSRYPELTAKVDAFFARVEARHGDDMQCDTGCSHCCHVRLTITGVEAAAIRARASRLARRARRRARRERRGGARRSLRRARCRAAAA